MSNKNRDAMHYRKRIIENAEESKKFLKVPAEMIFTMGDEELGSAIKEMMEAKIAEADRLIEHAKN
jgi:hypothetical protein